MEDSGGMVAVVQGLKDAGLVVTMLSSRYPPLGAITNGPGIPCPTQACQTVADSCTETAIRDRPTDINYFRSSYQMAHCVSSRFSPLRLPEYSLQGFQQYRSFTSRSPDEEAFVESLRKYPTSPVRSRSADLIERMLSYTQTKNGTRYSNTRSAKSLPSKEASKHVPLHSDEIPTRDTGIPTNESRPNYGYKRDVELVPVPMTNRKSRYDNQIGMYDYLKSNSKDKKLKGPEVRYLTNVKQCLREKLRQICDEESATICPKIQNRYSQHRRKYHGAEGRGQKSQKCSTCQESMAQDSPQNGIEILPSTSTEPMESKINKSSPSFKHSKACFCDRPGPCDCGTQPSRSILKSKAYPECSVLDINKHKQCTSTCEYECNTNEDMRQLKDLILNWSRDLPVYANFNTTDTMKREKLINDLIDNIGKLQRDDMFFENIEDNVKKIIKLLPMWRPQNPVDQESFENKLALSLLDKIKSIPSEKNEFKDEISNWVDSIPFNSDSIDKKVIVNELFNKLQHITQNQRVSDKEYKEALKCTIVNALNDLPIDFTGSRTTAINNIADILVEKLHTITTAQPNQSNIKNLVLDWVQKIPEIAHGTKISDDVLINELITRLSNLQNTDVNDRQEQMNNIITNWLNLVEEKKKCRIDRNTKYILTTQLIDQLINSRQMDKPRENVNNAVQKWYDEIKDTLGVTYIDNQSNLEILATKLKEIQSIENNENRQNTMRQEILKWLQNLQGKQGRNIESGIQENLVNKLITMINGDPNVQYAAENGSITQNIWKWLESQTEFKQDNYSQYRDLVIKLSRNLQDIRDKKGELTEYDVKAEVSNWFEKLSKQHGIQVDKNNQKKLQDKLLSVIIPQKRRKNWEKSNNIQELISKEVSYIIDNTIKSLDENDRKLLKEQLTQALVQNWKDIQSAQTKEVISKIKSILKQTTNLPETKIINLANSLVEKIKDATLSNLGDTLTEAPLILDSTLKDKLRSKVESIIKMLPLKDRQKVKDIITDTLVKRFEDFNSDNGLDMIYEVLKKSNLSERDALEVTNKIKEMSNQFKNEVINSTYASTSYGSKESLWMQKQMFMQRLEKEITDFMGKVFNESSCLHKETSLGDLYGPESLEDSINHYNKFKNLPLKTSTPTKSDDGKDIDIESQYKNQIKDIIKNWIISLQLDITDESFIEDMASDIAIDIIDRERYIQLSKTKRSSLDEMEHLKYQVFKWTSKLPNQIDLTTKITDIKELIKSLETLGIPDLIRQTTKHQYLAEQKEDSGSSMEYDSESIEENIKRGIWNWLNNITNLKHTSSEDKRIINDIVKELSIKLKNVLSSDIEVSSFETLCKDEVVNYLRKLDFYVNSTDKKLEHRASELINFLMNMEFFVNIINRHKGIPKEAANKHEKKHAIKKAVQDWCQKLPLKTGTSFDDMKDIVDNLAEAISRYLLITDMENINTFMDEILNNLKKLPLQFEKGDSKRLPEFTEKLIETLKGVLNDSEKYYSSEDESSVRKPVFKKAAEIMYDNVQNWCENLPLDLGMTDVNMEQVNMIKQNLATKLLKKVGELNLDPEIFHDDYLYEDVLVDEVDKILDDLVKSKQLEEVLPTLKQKLIKDLLEAKEEMKNEIAGFAYKQQLKDAISKTLSSIGLPILEETPFEVLKDNLADAFISLHYVGDDEELKKKCKDKIFNEVNKFCDDYLKRNPSTPLNVHQLNEELYKALKKVPIPKEESMRREVEQIRVKDIVIDWFNDLSLEETPSHIQENKMISILAKRLHEIENEAELKPDLDVDESMNNEISKWLKKFNVRSDNKANTESMKKQLINKLKATKNSRKFNESTGRKSINFEELESDSPQYPPSKLSAEDRAHLQRIKNRTSIKQTGLKSDDKKDASVSPQPITTGIQTEEKRVPDNYIYQRISQNASIQTIIREPEPQSSITPQVIVKEYYWNSHGSPTMERSGSILSTIQSPMTHTLTGNTQQKSTIETPHVTTASQTTPLPVSKINKAQEPSIGLIQKTQTQNDSIGTSTKNSFLTKSTTTAEQHISNEIYLDSQPSRCNTDDYLQLNSRKRPEIKSCQPYRGRASLSGEFENSPEVGTSNTIQQTRTSPQQIGQASNEGTDFQDNRSEFVSEGHIYENKNCLQDVNNLSPPCLRQPVCRTPTKDMECLSKRKKKSMQPCACGKPVVTKCTIRPQSPCQHSHHSNKSCYVSRKHCPKCWDGFCPHPSYLYFRQD